MLKKIRLFMDNLVNFIKYQFKRFICLGDYLKKDNIIKWSLILSVLSILILGVPYFTELISLILGYNLFKLNPAFTFENYLGLITGLSGVIITITVFLIQNTTQSYSSELLRLSFFKKKQFGFIIIYMFIALILFIYGSTFEVSNFYLIFSFFVCVGLIFNFIALILAAIYYMNILNVIKELEFNCINSIKLDTEKYVQKITIVGPIGLQPQGYVNLIDKVNPLFDTLIKSIVNNQNDVVNQCLKSIDNIVLNYLIETKDFKALDDKFLSEIIDRFALIVDTKFNTDNQKYLEQYTNTISNIGCNLLKYRYTFGGINNHATGCSSLLVNIFIKSYNFDRTIAPKLAIKGIKTIIITSINNNQYQSAITYYYDLEKIVKLCVDVPNYWSAILIQSVINSIKDIIVEINDSESFGNLNLFENLLEGLYKILSNCSKFPVHSQYIIWAPLINTDTIFVRISKANEFLPVYKKIVNEQKYNIVVKKYIEFCKKLLKNAQINLSFFSSFYSFLIEYVFLEEYYFKTNDFSKEIVELQDLFLNKYKLALKGDSHLETNNILSALEDAYCILIYKEDTINLELLADNLIEFYNSCKQDMVEDDYHEIYKLLKIIGAFMYGRKCCEKIQNKIVTAIIPDFKEISNESTLRSIFYTLDYPTEKHISSDWYIHPLSIWPPEFQEKINIFVNENDLEKFIKFHELVKVNNLKLNKKEE